MAQDVNEKRATERAAKLPGHVRFFTRQSRKGLPAPACAVALERGIRIPMPDGTHQIADRYIPQTWRAVPYAARSHPIRARVPLRLHVRGPVRRAWL